MCWRRSNPICSQGVRGWENQSNTRSFYIHTVPIIRIPYYGWDDHLRYKELTDSGTYAPWDWNIYVYICHSHKIDKPHVGKYPTRGVRGEFG